MYPVKERASATDDHRPLRKVAWKPGTTTDLLVGLVFLLCLAAVLLRYSPPNVAGWDDAYFVGRAACLSRTASALDGAGFVACFAEAKRPLLVSLAAVPFGSVVSTPTGLALIPVSFALLEWACAVALLVLLFALGIPRWMSLGVAAALAVAAPLTARSGAILADVPFSLIVAVMVLLPALEVRAAPGGAPRADVARGLLWGAVFGAGLLAKLTVIVFASVIGPALVVLRWRARGSRSVRRTLAFAALGASPALVITWLSWRQMYAHAKLATAGAYAQRYASGLEPLRHLAGVAASAPVVFAVCALLAGAATVAALRARRGGVLASVPGVLAIVVYEASTLMSANQDVRFQFPTLVALPFALLVPWAALDDGTAGARAVPVRHVVAWVAAGVLLAIPAAASYDFTNIVEQARFFSRLPSPRKVRVLLATDSPTLSMDTLAIALEVVPDGRRRFGLQTVAYDETDGRDIAFSFRKIEGADYVVLQSDPAKLSPDWTNNHVQEFRQFARSRGRHLPELSTTEFEVYGMSGSR